MRDRDGESWPSLCYGDDTQTDIRDLEYDAGELCPFNIRTSVLRSIFTACL
jgi:hypothetical protein